MLGMIFRFAGILFGLVKALMIAGLFVSVLSSLQAKTFHSKRVGLVSMLNVNQQLVGKSSK